mgnify:CR=1 FL=1
MESLFRQTDLETRFPLNMNVLDAAGTACLLGGLAVSVTVVRYVFSCPRITKELGVPAFSVTSLGVRYS